MDSVYSNIIICPFGDVTKRIMGEIADMMINGTLCEGCGEALEGEAGGFPRYCSSSCAKDRGVDYEKPNHDEKYDRFSYALMKLKQAGFEVKVCSEQNFHIKVGKWNFWAWTGKIYNPDVKLKDQQRGLNTFIQLLKSDQKQS